MEYINKPEPNVTYIKRIGAYGLLLNETGKLAVIKTSTGYFLPGGGLEVGEQLGECLEREFREETGIVINVGNKLSAISYFFYSTTLNRHMESEGHFYNCHYVEKIRYTM